MSTTRLNIPITATDKTDRAFASAKRGLKGIDSAVTRTKQSLFSLQGALLGLGVGAIGRSIINTASEVEGLDIRLKYLTGSVESGALAFKIMNEFASRVPFTLQDIERASPSLLTVADNVGELNELLGITGDLAAVTGLSFADTGMQLQRAMGAGIASADLFRERGITAFLGFEAGVSYSGERTKKMIQKMWKDGTTTAVGATKELAGAFTGQVSFMQDSWRSLKLDIANTGVFAEATKGVQALTSTLKDPEVIAGVKSTTENVMRMTRFLVEHNDKILAVVSALAGAKVGSIFGPYGAIAGALSGVAAFTFSDELFGGLDGTPLEQATYKIDRMREALAELQKGAKQSTRLQPAGSKDMSAIADLQVKLALAVADQQKIIAENQAAINKKALDGRIDEIEMAIAKEQKLLAEDALFKERLADRTFRNVHTNIKTLDLTEREAEEDAMVIEMAKRIEEIEKTKDALKKLAYLGKTQMELMANDISQAFKDSSDSIKDTLTGALMGAQSFGDAFRSIMRDVQRSFISKTISGPLVDGLMGMLPTFGGARANGGPVMAGSSYLVGERGPELFSPKTSGQIVPNEALTAGQTINNFTLSPVFPNVHDQQGAQAMLHANRGMLMGIFNQMLNERGRPSLV